MDICNHLRSFLSLHCVYFRLQ